MSVQVRPVFMVFVQIASMNMYATVRQAIRELAVILVSNAMCKETHKRVYDSSFYNNK